MNQQELMKETFHAMAQPVTALRAGVELGLCREMNQTETRTLLTECLCLIDRLMHDLSVFREIACLDEQPPLHPSDGERLLEIAVGEMAAVAHDCGIGFQLNTQAAVIVCNERMFQRAIFVLLDEMIAGAESGSNISVDLRPCGDEFRLDFHPGIPAGARQKLCRKLMESAGGGSVCFTSECTSIAFPKSSYRRLSTTSTADKKFLTTYDVPSINGTGRKN
jgi:K+-sensing histidine kinase KdpD